MQKFALTRRHFVTSAAAGAAILAAAPVAAAPVVAGAEEAPAQDAMPVETINCSGIVVDPSKVTENIYADVLVVGGGFAGLAAAVQAGENGDNVILVEAQEVLGGNGQGVEGTFAVGSKWQKEAGITFKPAEVLQEELAKTQWCADGLFYRDLCTNSADNLQWVIEECGGILSGLIDNYPLGPVGGKVDSFHWWQDGCAAGGYIEPMAARARELGVDIRFGNRGLEFSYDGDGKVDGVYAMDAFGDLVNFKATVVILATGGFANDDRRLIRNGFNLDELERIGTPGHYGDAVNMVLAAGGSEYTSVCYLKYNRISRNFDIETFGPFWSAFAFGGPFLWLNKDAERFVDESCAITVGNVITQSHPIHNQGCYCYSIFDSTVCEQQMSEYKALADEWGDDLSEQMETLIADQDDVWRADSIADLAKQAGLDPEKVQAAVDEYNEACASGDDYWFGKGEEFLAPIVKAPFYMTKIHVTMEGPLGGVRTDRTFRALLADGGRMENVFVIGLDSVMLYRDVYPMDVPGSASAECLNGGRVSANEGHAIVEAAGPNVAKEEIVADDKTNAKQVIMAASNIMTTMDMGLSQADSPATITMGDPAYDELFNAIKNFKKVATLDLSACEFTVKIMDVFTATARADSQQVKHHYTIKSADMVVNGAHVVYDSELGFATI